MTTGRLRGAVVAVAALGALVVAPASAACTGLRSGRTASVAAPAGADAESLGVAYSKSGATQALYLPTARTVLRSTDAGCTWQVTASLDAAPVTALGKVDVLYTFYSLAVSPPGRDGKHTIYAVAADGAASVAFAPPAVVATSTDDGAHWTYHEPAPAELAGDYPRCMFGYGWTVVRAGPDPTTAYLLCNITTFSEAWLMFGPGECQVAYYVTHDAAKTWRAVQPRFSDPAKVSTTDPRGCDRRTMPVPDPVRPKVVWDPVKGGLVRSGDDGHTFAPFASFTPAMGEIPSTDVTSAGGRTTALIWYSARIATSTGGPAVDLPSVPVKAAYTGFLQQVAFVPGTRDIVAFYCDPQKRARTFRFSDRTRRWSELPAAPIATFANGFEESAGVALVTSPTARDLYLADRDAKGGPRIARYSL
jgi:hypothetical protein